MALLALVLAGAVRAQSSAPAVVEPAGERIALSQGRLFLPAGFETRAGAADLLVHFHGAASVVERAFVEARASGALVVVILPGLSDAYRKAFAGAAAFDRLLADARAAIRERSPRTGEARGRLVLSSFSAGYGAIREILRRPEQTAAVDAILLADSLHASHDAEGRPKGEQMEPFRAFAKGAARGEKTFWSTHSALVPEGYASTTETNDDLIAAVGGKRVPAEGANAWRMALASRADAGNFHVLGYAGTDGPAHMRHLHAIGDLFARLQSGR